MSRVPGCGSRAVNEVRQTMERRKFVIGMGALASGSAAAVGTGALSTATVEGRTVDVNVAADSSGFVEIAPENDTYAEENENGQLELTFDDDSDGGVIAGDAQGLNPNSTYNFSEVFSVRNAFGNGDLYFVIEKDGFDVDITLEASGEGNPDESKSLLVDDYTNPDNLPKLLEPGTAYADITIETPEEDVGSAGGSLTIHAANGDDRSELSDILS